jgi:hypothetical protein
MKADHATIEDLHRTYCSLSKMEVSLRFNRESSWVEFIRAGFTKADLEAVLHRLLRLIECGERRPEALKFSNVVEGLDRFEEELAMIKAEANGLKVGEQRISVFDLTRIIEEKHAIANRLEDSHATRDAFGLSWRDEGAKADYRQLISEIIGLRKRIAALA